MTNPGALRLYLVRHGVTEWNKSFRMQGHTDVPLSSEGRVEAERIAARLAADPFQPEAVWSSDLARARETAEAIARPLNLSVRTTSLLRETMLGDWEGLTREEIEARGDAEHLGRYRLDSHLHRPPGSESLEIVWKRMVRASEEIRARHPSGQVAIVGHGGSLRTLLCVALEASISSLRHIWLENASLSIIEEAGETGMRLARVLLMNDTSHLR